MRKAERARIVLFAASGQQDKEIASVMAITPKKVSRWRKRFLALGVVGLEKDAPRAGRKPNISARLRTRGDHDHAAAPGDATHWSTRSMAAAVGISEASVRRIWRAHGLKPHRVETFKISNDPQFAEKLEDIVDLYLKPPEHALVLCADEKSQIQALDRTQPGLPLKRGRGATMTHDYQSGDEHRHLVCRAECGQRRSLWPVPRAASPSGMARELSPSDGPDHPGQRATPLDLR